MLAGLYEPLLAMSSNGSNGPLSRFSLEAQRPRIGEGEGRPSEETPPYYVYALLAKKCGAGLLKEIQGPDSHAVFDVTLEHAARLYDSVCGPHRKKTTDAQEMRLSADHVSDGSQINGGHSFARQVSQASRPPSSELLRQISRTISSDAACVMTKDGLVRGLEHDGFRGLLAEPAFHALWSEIGQENISLQMFHSVLRLLKLHLLCGTLKGSNPRLQITPDLPDETGFIGIMDWNPRAALDAYTCRPRNHLEVFLTHRNPSMKMRWVHCAAVRKETILRLAVKYQLHPLPVEDTMQLEQQTVSVSLVREYANNFFIVIPLLRLSSSSREMLRLKRKGRELSERRTDASPADRQREDARPLHIQVEQGRLALFVSGLPNFDTVISVQTKWQLHVSDEEEEQKEARHPEVKREPAKRNRVLRLLTCLGWISPHCFQHFFLFIISMCFRKSPDPAVNLGDSAHDRKQLEAEEEDAESHHGTEAFDNVALEIQRDFSVLRAGNAAWLLWRLLDVCIDELSPILAAYRARLQWFAGHIAVQRARAGNEVERDLFRMKVELDWLQRKARPMVRVVKHLIRERSIEPDVTRYLEDVEDHLETFIEEISRSVGVCDSLRDQVRSYRDRERQGVLYVLAIVTSMFTPMQLLTGIYGMNWQDAQGKPFIPFLGSLSADRGWWLFWGLGLAVVSSIFFTFRVFLKWI